MGSMGLEIPLPAETIMWYPVAHLLHHSLGVQPAKQVLVGLLLECCPPVDGGLGELLAQGSLALELRAAMWLLVRRRLVVIVITCTAATQSSVQSC